MGMAWFNSTKDATLAAASANFSTRISATPTAFNLTAAQATSYAAVDAAWQSAYEAARDPNSRTRSLVVAKDAARDTMKRAASALAKYVYASATVSDQQRSNLGLSVRAIPAPVGPPGTPYDFKYTLSRVQGADVLSFTWKSDNPRGAGGTIYQVYRQVGEAGPWVYLGGSGQRKYEDPTIPLGVGQVSYQVQGIRSTAAGAWGTFVVSYGSGEQAKARAEAMKLAA